MLLLPAPMKSSGMSILVFCVATTLGCSDELGGVVVPAEPLEGGASPSPDAGGAEASAEASIEAPEVRIVNLSLGNTPFESTMNFVLENRTGAAIESIEGIEIRFGSEPKFSEYIVDFAKAGFDSTTCADWRVGAGMSSGVIEIVMKKIWVSGSSSDFYWLLSVPCEARTQRYIDDVFPRTITPMRDDRSPLTLRLSGLLTSAAPWTATATGSYRR